MRIREETGRFLFREDSLNFSVPGIFLEGTYMFSGYHDNVPVMCNVMYR